MRVGVTGTSGGMTGQQARTVAALLAEMGATKCRNGGCIGADASSTRPASRRRAGGHLPAECPEEAWLVQGRAGAGGEAYLERNHDIGFILWHEQPVQRLARLRREARLRIPCCDHLQDGVWEPRGVTPDEAGSVALLTTEANDLVAPCHDRMPVILPPEAWDAWLGEATPDALAALLRPFPAEAMAALAVGKAVGSVRNDSPACLEPALMAQVSLF